MSCAYGILYAEDFEDTEPPPPRFTRAERDQAVDDACTAAVASARADWAQSDQRHRTAALAALSDSFAALATEIAAQQASIAAAGAQAMLAMLAAMLPSLSAHHGPSEVSALLQVTLPRLQQEPRVTVAVAPGVLELVRPDLLLFDDPVATAVTLVADRRLAPGDVRLTWPNGSLVRDTGATAAALLAAVQTMLPPLPQEPATAEMPAIRAPQQSPVPELAHSI